MSECIDAINIHAMRWCNKESETLTKIFYQHKPKKMKLVGRKQKCICWKWERGVGFCKRNQQRRSAVATVWTWLWLSEGWENEGTGLQKREAEWNFVGDRGAGPLDWESRGVSSSIWRQNPMNVNNKFISVQFNYN